MTRRRILLVLCTAELLGMSLWFVGGVLAPELRERWDLSPAEVAWLTGAVQLGFVAGTALSAVLNVADLWPSRRLFAVSAAAGALANAGLLVDAGFLPALGFRFLTGFCLAGVYPPAMKMAATWFVRGRGLAIGTLVGALTVGKALPWLFGAVPGLGLVGSVGLSSGGAVLAALLVLAFYREGPHPFERRAFAWGRVGEVLADRPTRLAIGGYLGHMWELYAMWTWSPVFLAAALVAGGADVAPGLAAALGFGTIAAGGLGCFWAGWAADRVGRERIISVSLWISGACSLGVGLAWGAPAPVLVAVLWAWGFFVVADSAQLSALVTEVAPRHVVGTALTLQVSAGFLLTLVTIQLVPVWVEGAGSWRWAFALLALGPAAGLAAIRRLRVLRAASVR